MCNVTGRDESSEELISRYWITCIRWLIKKDCYNLFGYVAINSVCTSVVWMMVVINKELRGDGGFFWVYTLIKDFFHRLHFSTPTLQQVGLMAYIGNSVRASVKDFLALSLVRGHLMLTWDLGAGEDSNNITVSCFSSTLLTYEQCTIYISTSYIRSITIYYILS